MVQVDVHLIVGLVHVQHAARGGLHQASRGGAAGQRSAQTSSGGRNEPRNKSRRVQVAQPLAIGYVALASRHRAHVAGVDQY